MAHQKALRSECKLVLKASVTVWLVSTVRTGVLSQVEHGMKKERMLGFPSNQLELTHYI